MTNFTAKKKEPKKQVLYKFILLCLVLGSYFVYLGIKFDFMTGGIAALLTWSFFVLCTPIADAGFLLDFPLRLLFGVRMFISELVVWAVAIAINLLALFYFVEYYQTTPITKLMYTIMTTPFPYWAVVVLSGVGTFLSIRFADELMDVIHHHDRHYFHKHNFKHEIVIILFFVLVFVGYYKLMSTLGLEVG